MTTSKLDKKTTDRTKEEADSRQWSIRALSTVIKLNNIIGFLPIDLEGIVKAVVDEVYSLFHPHICCIHMIGEQGVFKMAAFKSMDGFVPDVHISNHTSACAAIKDGFPYVACGAPDAQLRYSEPCPNCKVPEKSTISHACIPMITGNDLHGVLSISFRTGKMLSRQELDVLLSIASQVAMAIQRFRLFEKLKHEKTEIERAYEEIRSLNRLLERKIEEVEEAQRRFVESEKLAATGELAAGLCHEINNPISIILNRIECLKMEAQDSALPDPVIKDLDMISSQAVKVSSLVQDLLIFSRHHPVTFEQVNMGALLERVAAMCQGELNKSDCVLHLNAPRSLPAVQGDGERLEQVFLNLISNAVHAMPEGGNIYMDIVLPFEKPDRLEIRIRDEGMGIAENHLHRIFDPFFTTKKLGKGTGLGLSICFGIVKNHGGNISVESVVNKGSMFTVALPLRSGRTNGV